MYKYRRVIIGVIAAILALALVMSIVIPAFGESSKEIQEKIEGLKKQEAAIEQKQQELDKEISGNQSELLDLVEKKGQIDQKIALIQDSIENKTQLIQEYNLLIAEKQNELDDALAERDRLSEQYKARIRSMEENGKITYWSILFKASSFSDMLSRVDMINEIALADARMIDKIEAAAEAIETARQELALEKVALEETKEQLAQDEAALEQERAEADEVFAELWADKEALEAAAQKYEDAQNYLLAQIATQEKNYKAAVAAEEEARRKAAEEKARKEREQREREAAAREQASTGGGSSGGSSSGGGSSGGGSSSSGARVSGYGFIWPSDCHTITCYYGPRVHPITHVYSNHSGIDIGAYYGTPIYACASGTVTTATYGTAYGNHVVINHGNGFSTLYGHMCRYIVSPGTYVTRGQVIGYVGSTGWSTAPHLHLTIYYNGSLVNPLSYLP